MKVLRQQPENGASKPLRTKMAFNGQIPTITTHSPWIVFVETSPVTLLADAWAWNIAGGTPDWR